MVKRNEKFVLMSMTDFVLEQAKKHTSTYELAHLLINYARFLKQNIELWMFVPCKLVDGVCIVLEEPKQRHEQFYYIDENGEKWFKGELFRQFEKEYQEAKERVLFEGFENKSKQINEIFDCCETIEDIVKNGYNPILTESAKKEIGL